jgi:hypothetical protein
MALLGRMDGEGTLGARATALVLAVVARSAWLRALRGTRRLRADAPHHAQ